MGEINRGGLPDLDRKSRSGFFFHPDASRLSRLGTPDLPDWSGWRKFFSRFIETTRDKSGKVENPGDFEIISKSPDFLDFSRLFALFSRSFGDRKSRLISTSRLIPTNKSRDNSRIREKLRLSRFPPTPRIIPTCLVLSRWISKKIFFIPTSRGDPGSPISIISMHRDEKKIPILIFGRDRGGLPDWSRPCLH